MASLRWCFTPTTAPLMNSSSGTVEILGNCSWEHRIGACCVYCLALDSANVVRCLAEHGFSELLTRFYSSFYSQGKRFFFFPVGTLVSTHRSP